MSKLLLLSLILWLSLFKGVAQEDTWNLKKCISVAMKNNLDIQVKQLEIAIAMKNHYNPLYQMLPTVNMNADHSYNFGSTIDPSTNARVSSNIQLDNFYLNTQMELLNFNTLASEAKNRIDIKKARINKNLIEYEYKLRILEQYFQTLYTQELVKIQEEQYQNTIYNTDRVRKEVELGNKPKSDLYDIQLTLAQEEKRISETTQLFSVQRLQLFQIMNHIPKNINNITFMPLIAANNTVYDYNTELAYNPQILLAKINTKSSQKEIAIQRANAMPSLTAYYGFSSFYSQPLNQQDVAVNDFWTQVDHNKNHQLGLQLTIPVFNGFKNSRKVKTATLALKKSKLEQANEIVKVQQQIDQVKLKKKQYKGLEEKLDNTVFYAKESFRTTESKFLNGQVEAVIYTTVKNQLLSSQYDKLKNNLLIQYSNLKIHLLRTASL